MNRDEPVAPAAARLEQPTVYTRFAGQWCENCRTALSYRPASGNCPSCGPYPLRPATVTVEPTDQEGGPSGE